MFKLDITGAYWQTVTVPLPMGDGKTHDLTLRAQFRRLDADELKALQTRLIAGEIDDDQVVAEVLQDWENVADEHGEPLPFNPANRARLLKVYPTAASLVRAFFESLKDARQKN